MMDSHDTNQPLNQGELEEEKKTVEVSEAITETPTEEANAEEQVETTSRLTTKEEVLARMKELALNAESAGKQELDRNKAFTNFIMPNWKQLKNNSLTMAAPKKTTHHKAMR